MGFEEHTKVLKIYEIVFADRFPCMLMREMEQERLFFKLNFLFEWKLISSSWLSNGIWDFQLFRNRIVTVSLFTGCCFLSEKCLSPSYFFLLKNHSYKTVPTNSDHGYLTNAQFIVKN
jgi:hypothetical protein